MPPAAGHRHHVRAQALIGHHELAGDLDRGGAQARIRLREGLGDRHRLARRLHRLEIGEGIEAGAGDGYVPTVRVLSRRQVRQIFRDFHSCTVHTNGVMPDDFLIADVLMRRFNRMTLERYLGFVGWYIVARASISRGVSHTDLDPKPMPRISNRV